MIDRSKPILRDYESHLIESYMPLTPDKLREIASILEERGIIHLECHVEGYEGYFVCEERRFETQEEANKRYKSEVEAEERQKARRKAEYEKLAKEFG
jgi:tRNA G46 methylase TrmB